MVDHFDFPDSYIEFLAFLKVGFDAPYRMIEGAVEALSGYISFIKDIVSPRSGEGLIHLLRGKKPAEMISRVNKESGEPITAVIDSTGLTTTTKGAYIVDKWRKEKRKFLKLHILADKKTGKIAGFRVTSEHTGGFKEVHTTRQRSIEEKHQDRRTRAFVQSPMNGQARIFKGELETTGLVGGPLEALDLGRFKIPFRVRGANVRTDIDRKNEEQCGSSNFARGCLC